MYRDPEKIICIPNRDKVPDDCPITSMQFVNKLQEEEDPPKINEEDGPNNGNSTDAKNETKKVVDTWFTRIAFDDELDILFGKNPTNLPLTTFTLTNKRPCMDPTQLTTVHEPFEMELQ